MFWIIGVCNGYGDIHIVKFDEDRVLVIYAEPNEKNNFPRKNKNRKGKEE